MNILNLPLICLWHNKSNYSYIILVGQGLAPADFYWLIDFGRSKNVINWISCKIKWPKKMTHREISDIMLSDQTKHDWRFQNESLTV